jgi:hypothetical protein
MTLAWTVGLITLISTLGAIALGLPVDVWNVVTIAMVGLAVALFCRGWRPH